MPGLHFRSLETLIDTSSLERRAFNIAFAESSLNWAWTASEFQSLKNIAGERHRIAWYAEHCIGKNISCDFAGKILWRKEKALQRLLNNNSVEALPLPGTLRLLEEAATANVPAELAITQAKERSVLDHSIGQFEAFALLKLVLPPVTQVAKDRFDQPRIELGTTSTAGMTKGPIQACISVSSSDTGKQACISHFGEINNPAIQLSGYNILQHGKASLQSLLRLTKNRKTSFIKDGKSTRSGSGMRRIKKRADNSDLA